MEEERIDRTSEKDDYKDYDRDLFEILRKERKQLADKSKVPPYVIFSDKTLIEMATFFPQSKQSMLDITWAKRKPWETISREMFDAGCLLLAISYLLIPLSLI